MSKFRGHPADTWVVVINHQEFEEKARYPWVAVTKALKKWRLSHLQSSMQLFDIYIVNKTLTKKQEAAEHDRSQRKNVG